VPGVAVTVIQRETNQSRIVQTNGSGLYSAPLLPAGIYEITAAKSGFKGFRRAGVELQINDTVEVDIPLEVGAAAETVTISAETPLLSTETSSLGEVVDNRTIEELPVPFGTAYFLIGLSAGVNGTTNQARQ